MASIQVEKLVKLYTTLAATPSLSSARILNPLNNNIVVQSKWLQRNLELKTNQRFLLDHIFKSGCSEVSSGLPIDITTELMSAMTYDEKFRAVLRQVTIDNSKKEFIEIWDKQHLVKNYDLSALDVHGNVYTDSEFSSFKWSPDNTKLLYIAEKKLPKTEPFYKQKPQDKKDKKDDETIIAGNEYIYKPHWGEQLVGKHRPVIVILDTIAETITALSEIPDDLSPGQVIWTKEQDIIGVAWKHEPRYLGLVACTNRASWIFLLKDGKYQKLSDDGCAVHSPRLNPRGDYLVWIERNVTNLHHYTQRLMLRDLKSEEAKNDVIVDIVQTSNTIKKEKQFYGIYGRLVDRCWSDDEHLFFSTPQKNNIFSYIVNIKTKTIVEVQNENGSLSVLDVKENVVAFLSQSLTQPSCLMVGCFQYPGLGTGDILKLAITTPPNLGLGNFTYEANEYTYDNDDEIKQFNFIYFGPKNEQTKSVPFIIVPHGGPHSNYANTFSLDFSFLTLSGFALVLVNYRGSTGMGAATVKFLEGRVGDVDVKDCITAAEESLKKYPWLDSKRIGLCGGSHGGFLVAHLSGQVPDMFKAVVARNPVIDIAFSFSSSDIPDWCAAAIASSYNVLKPGNQTDFTKLFVRMLECSPIVHVDKVKAPTLISIGTSDLRVSCFNGKSWYHRLKTNNVKTKLLVYDDNHQLLSGSAEIDHIINDCIWLLEHLKKDDNAVPKNEE
ncbi:acylamino-acid-releasing enzyme-like isoform X2 [Odontomachus brunneus]|uniref:acylamino-acid-releasing enzyme-like isoform X2 n=1 Tax=Odontomachus brunneus TaxID=486640 RepID=UPI0013F25A01|nr:acylamino-acid-releasing enzyme-like isoform X2 [Odontomachus brunneus]